MGKVETTESTITSDIFQQLQAQLSEGPQVKVVTAEQIADVVTQALGQTDALDDESAIDDAKINVAHDREKRE